MAFSSIVYINRMYTITINQMTRHEKFNTAHEQNKEVNRLCDTSMILYLSNVCS